MDFLVLIVSWEVINFSTYFAILFFNKVEGDRCLVEGEAAISAAIKYFLLSAVTSAILWLGIAIRVCML
jgi:NADH:ubiquinone oxidoreductase subunit 2 (subunit N)